MTTERRRAWWRPSSVRARLTVGYALAVAVPLVAIAGGSYLTVGHALLGRTDHFVEEALHAFAIQLRAEEREHSTIPSAIAGAFTEFRFRDLQFVVYDSTGAVAGADDRTREASPETDMTRGQHRATPIVDIASLTAALAPNGDRDRVTFTLRSPNGSFRVRTLPAPVFGTTFRVAGVYPLVDVERTLAELRGDLFIVVPLLIALSAFGGYALAGRSLAPVREMGRHAAEINARNLHERLPVSDPDDEFGQLAQVVNAVLDRLEHAIAQQRRFMADASHELRTPAAIIRTETEVTLSRAHRDEADYRESAAVVNDAALRLTRIVGDLFVLARADAGHLAPRRDRVDLSDIVLSAGRVLRGIAESRDVQLELPPIGDAPFRGDEDLLGRMILNLVDNAIKFSAPGGTVTVTLTGAEHDPAFYHIGVVDGGPGIPPDAHDRIFDRFFRVDRSRAHSDQSATGGAGLGLAIARWAAEANGGRLELVASRPGYTEFRASLPIEE